MKTSVTYKVMKPYLSIFVAGFVCAQSVFAAETMGPAVGKHGFQTQENLAAIARYEAAIKRPGYGLSSAKNADDLKRITRALLEQTSAMGFADPSAVKESNTISGASVAKKVISDKIESYKTLYDVMTVNKRALDVLINSPMQNPTLKRWYIAIVLANGIPTLMARMDKLGTPVITWHREKVRAVAMAIPLVLSAFIRAQDPAATIDLMKINQEIRTELEALSNIKGASPEFRDQISDIISVTANQLSDSAKNFGIVESSLKGFYNSEESKIMTYSIAGISLLYALLVVFDSRAAEWVASARAAAIAIRESAPEIQAAVRGAMATTREAAAAGQQAIQAGAKAVQAEIAEVKSAGAYESLVKISGSKGGTTLATGGTAGYDGLGYALASTSDRAAGIASKVSADYGKVLSSIEKAMERWQATLDSAAQKQ